jgi:PKHD-type hydroxylase
MFYRYEVLNSIKISHIRNLFDIGTWEDGSVTGSSDKNIKNNLQLDPENSLACWNLFEKDYIDHPIVTGSLVTCTYTIPTFSKYGPGCHYGWHYDHAYMGSSAGNSMRSDISTTVFLNDPEEYEGGVLELLIGTETLEIKLPAGWAFSYPTGTKHRVTRVTSGERRVAVLWGQSRFKEPMDRMAYANMIETTLKYNILTADHPAWEMQCALDIAKMHLLRSKGDVRS